MPLNNLELQIWVAQFWPGLTVIMGRTFPLKRPLPGDRATAEL